MAAQEEVLIAPSVLSADFLHLADELASISNADLVHCDVMDGEFVPNLTFGPLVIEKVASATDVPIDAHLMIHNPDRDALTYVKAGASIVSVHAEASTHLHRTVYAIKNAGARAGVVINPSTPVIALDAIIEDVDLVCLMSVNPGFGGQAFIEGTYRKLRQLQALCMERGVCPLIEVDGGVCAANAKDIVAAGANTLVAGSAVFSASDRAATIETLREQGNEALGLRCQ